MSVSVRETASADEREAALALRERVFCGEQGVPLEAERDALDAEAVHLVAVDGGSVVATCRVLGSGDEARIGRMAVAAPLRRSGIGAALLRGAESIARRRGATRVTLHAQIRAHGFYARQGYADVGDRFLEEGIEHIAMEKQLA